MDCIISTAKSSGIMNDTIFALIFTIATQSALLMKQVNEAYEKLKEIAI
jgi:hypothetical protein